MLKSPDDIVEALGGTSEVARLLGVGPSAVSNWRAFGVIPSEWFVLLRAALSKRSMTAHESAFGFKRLREARR